MTSLFGVINWLLECKRILKRRLSNRLRAWNHNSRQNSVPKRTRVLRNGCPRNSLMYRCAWRRFARSNATEMGLFWKASLFAKARNTRPWFCQPDRYHRHLHSHPTSDPFSIFSVLLLLCNNCLQKSNCHHRQESWSSRHHSRLRRHRCRQGSPSAFNASLALSIIYSNSALSARTAPLMGEWYDSS